MTAERPHPVPGYAWVVFALTFGLLISDYMARQVLNAVFPLLKSEWALSGRSPGEQAPSKTSRTLFRPAISPEKAQSHGLLTDRY